jgi:hypothetical protein
MLEKLPTKKGERAILWHDFEDRAEGPCRVVLISNGRGKWSIRTEAGLRIDDLDEDLAKGAEPYDDGHMYAWSTGLVLPSFELPPGGGFDRAPSKVIVEASWALSQVVWLRPAQQVESPTIDLAADKSLISRTKGNKRLTLECVGSNYAGHPLMTMSTNKPMTAGELLVALQNLALALDRYDEEHA